MVLPEQPSSELGELRVDRLGAAPLVGRLEGGAELACVTRGEKQKLSLIHI